MRGISGAADPQLARDERAPMGAARAVGIIMAITEMTLHP
jgi:hypothetical protein